jgi:hypothetical protein
MSALSHAKSLTQADFGGTVTVFNSQGSTVTAAATDLARPADWNSVHQQYITISGNTEGTANATATNIVWAGGYGIELSMSTVAGGATISIEERPDKYYANLPFIANSTTLQPTQSTSAVAPFLLENPITAKFIRLMMSGATSVASTTAATTGNTTWSAGATKSHNFMIMSRGVGANSQSLQYVTSTQVVEQYSQRWSAAANSTQFSVSMEYSLPVSSGVSAFNKNWSSSAASLNFHSSQITDLTGFKQVDFPFAMSLIPGQYWLVYGQSSSTNSNFTSIGLRDIITYNVYGMSQPNNSWGTFGAATNASVQWKPGLGSYTTNATTTASIALANVSSSASNNIIYFQLMSLG